MEKALYKITKSTCAKGTSKADKSRWMSRSLNPDSLLVILRVLRQKPGNQQRKKKVDLMILHAFRLFESLLCWCQIQQAQWINVNECIPKLLVPDPACGKLWNWIKQINGSIRIDAGAKSSIGCEWMCGPGFTMDTKDVIALWLKLLCHRYSPIKTKQ